MKSLHSDFGELDANRSRSRDVHIGERMTGGFKDNNSQHFLWSNIPILRKFAAFYFQWRNIDTMFFLPVRLMMTPGSKIF